ncbi:PREDICTED: serine protease SP24D-like [Bactrocera latifrons]|uniref:serine protease SP24D-like n=1 Tax=Bactrocera latifrons TaxID=174628 RepID=UPI0008DE0DF5|nr:PREDICTED: serine protease SP24D-like [Bactrocera latifrons]
MDYQKFFIKLFVACCLVVEATQNENVSAELRPSPRIVNGLVAASGQFPYQVSVRINNQHICGGALITQKFVVTAAHCVYNIDNAVLGVQAGTVNRIDGGEFRAVSTVITHPQYGFDNDIALLELKTPYNYSDVIKPVAITTWDVPAGESVIISGWGRIYEGGLLSNKLLYTRVLTTLKDEDCAKSDGTLNPSILCLLSPQGRGFCDGDDGGPAVYKNILIGIASYITKGCGTIAKGGFTKLAYYKEWIDAIVTGLVPN